MSFISAQLENAPRNLATLTAAIESVPYSRRVDFMNALLGSLSNHLTPEIMSDVTYRALEPFTESETERARR